MSDHPDALFYSVRYRQALEEIRDILKAGLMGDMISMGRLEHVVNAALAPPELVPENRDEADDAA